MNKSIIGLVCVVCVGLCFGQNNGFGRRYPHVQPPMNRYRSYCAPCPPVFPPQQPQQPPQNLPQCPCVKPPGSKECATYDKRLQAATLEEALYSFPDLGKRDPAGNAAPLFDASKEAQSLQDTAKGQSMSGMASPVAPQMQRFVSFGAAMPESDVAQTQAPPPSSNPLFGGEYSCNSPACKACLLTVVNGFISSANSSTDHSTLGHFLSMRKQLEMEAGGAQCPGMEQPSAAFSMMQAPALKAAGADAAQPVPPEIIAQIVRAIQPDGAARQQRSTTDEDEQIHLEAAADEKWREQMQFGPQSNTRAKRQSTAPSSTDLIGTATKLGCDYQRGTPIGDSKYIGLCNICWQWRRLPDKYFPPYLNEVSCDSKDDQCLSGWGKCRPVLRSVNVLINHGTTNKEEWQQESIFTVAACECQVEIGSPFHTLAAR